jgi:quercetin dioxygenase-like cupin family protein
MSGFSTPAIGSTGEQRSYRFLDTLTYVRVSGDETDGRVAVVEMQLREGHAPPMHVHQSADETIHVLDGQVAVHTAEETRVLEPDSSVVLPKGEQHSLVARERSTVLASATPAGFDAFVEAVGQPAETETVPTEPPSEEAIGRVNELAPEHDIEIVGPPPVEL